MPPVISAATQDQRHSVKMCSPCSDAGSGMARFFHSCWVWSEQPERTTVAVSTVASSARRVSLTAGRRTDLLVAWSPTQHSLPLVRALTSADYPNRAASSRVGTPGRHIDWTVRFPGMTSGSSYLDAASSEPLHPAGREALLAALDRGYADPRRLHRAGRDARLLLDNARAAVAESLEVRPDEVSFVASGTHAVHLGLLGLHRGARDGGRVAHTAVEHSAVLH